MSETTATSCTSLGVSAVAISPKESVATSASQRQRHSDLSSKTFIALAAVAPYNERMRRFLRHLARGTARLYSARYRSVPVILAAPWTDAAVAADDPAVMISELETLLPLECQGLAFGARFVENSAPADNAALYSTSSWYRSVVDHVGKALDQVKAGDPRLS